MIMLKNYSDEKYDIIIQAGQSNSEGYGFGDAAVVYRPNELVWYMNNDFTISRAAEIVIGNEIQSTFVLSFADEYIKNGLLKEGRKLLILRAAVGGTGFLDNHWNMTGDLYLRMMEMIRAALALNRENRIVGFLWHQGETDATLYASYEVHYRHLMGLLCSVRDEFGITDVPFIAGDFVHQWKNENLEICTPVLDAIRAVCRDCGNGAFVETDGLLSNRQELHRNPLGWEDHIHFSRKAVYELGRRYFEEYAKIIGIERRWKGYRCKNLQFEDHNAIIVYPKEGTANGYLAVKTEYWEAFQEAIEIPLLENGFHLCYIKNDNRFGTDEDLDRKARFIRFVQAECGLTSKCIPVGMSCGGMIAIKLAARYPELIKCMYLDAPVVNYMSWPCGFGIGNSGSGDYSEILNALGLQSISQLIACRDMPLDRLPALVENKIPVVMVSGDSDQTVPYCENGVFLENAYKEAGVDIEVYIKAGGDHHPHGLADPQKVLDFIIKQCCS